MHKPQSALETILIMSYNCGRAHEKEGGLSIEDGRKLVVGILTELVEGIDPGDLSKPLLKRPRT